jgi:sugar O-acyltransferase (sialic acid O-acetyltransferase NeuD family)
MRRLTIVGASGHGKVIADISEKADMCFSADMEHRRPDMNRLKDLYIIGAGGFGREVAWLVERINEVEPTWNLNGFIDDDTTVQGTLMDDYQVVGGCDYLVDSEQEVWVVCAVGSAGTRKKIIKRLERCSYIKFATLVDPSVLCSKRVNIGEGSIICAGTVITVDVFIGNHVIINLDCTVGHDDIIHNFVTVYPSVNISGNVEIGECAELGTGMQIIQGKNIGKESIIGAGAVVVQDIPEKCTAVGTPAKPIKFFHPGI